MSLIQEQASAIPITAPNRAPCRRKVTLPQLVAATYLMVAGGPYGLEEIIQSAGYQGAVLILLLTPVLWSLPTALMVSELSSAVPESGGYYVWVKRALGPFWGFQEAWLSLVASIFDMALYPTLFTLYLARLVPAVGEGRTPVLVGALVVLICTVVNLRGARAVGTSSLISTLLLLSPFGILIVGVWMQPAARAQVPNPAPARSTCSAAFSLPCGTTWAGTTRPRSRARWSARAHVSAGHDGRPGTGGAHLRGSHSRRRAPRDRDLEVVHRLLG